MKVQKTVLVLILTISMIIVAVESKKKKDKLVICPDETACEQNSRCCQTEFEYTCCSIHKKCCGGGYMCCNFDKNEFFDADKQEVSKKATNKDSIDLNDNSNNLRTLE